MKTKPEYTIRNCHKDDLRKLEWDEELVKYRNLYDDTFVRFQRGEVIMLVAEIDGFPVGQIWIDLTKKSKESIGILYALRVMKKFQNRGIGTALIKEAQIILDKENFHIAEISVEKTNPEAKKLYEKLGYKVICESVGSWTYKNPVGKTIKVKSPEWVLQKILTEQLAPSGWKLVNYHESKEIPKHYNYF